LKYVNLTEFSKNTSSYVSTIEDTVRGSFSLTSSERLNVTKIHFPSSSSSVVTASVLSFRRSLTSSSSSIGSVTVNYTVSISSKSHNFTFFSNQLQKAISSGHFTFLLQINALQHHAYGFKNASSNSVTIVEILSSSSSTPVPSDNPSEKSVEKRFLLPIIIGGCIVICFSIVAGYLLLIFQQWRKNKLLNKIHIDGVGNDDEKM
jgi:hypothetical protein